MEVLNLTDGKKLLLVDAKEIPCGMTCSEYGKILLDTLVQCGVLNTVVLVNNSNKGIKKSRIPRKLKECIQESYKKIIEHEKNKMDCGSKE